MRKFIGMAILLCTVAVVKGQRSFIFSIHANPQFAWFGSDEGTIEPDGAILHINPGLQLDYFFAENYAFAAGFGLNNLGGKLRYSDSTMFRTETDTLWATPGQSVKYRVQYLELPLGLKFKTAELGYATFFFQLGFSPMINIGAWADSGESAFGKKEVKESTNLFSLGYHVGGGVEYTLGGNTAAVAGIRWSSGLTDVTGDDLANVTLRAISLQIGIKF